MSHSKHLLAHPLILSLLAIAVAASVAGAQSTNEPVSQKNTGHNASSTCSTHHSVTVAASASAPAAGPPPANEDWADLEFVERDLMDYIVDLKARYKDKIDTLNAREATLSGRLDQLSSAPPTSGTVNLSAPQTGANVTQLANSTGSAQPEAGLAPTASTNAPPVPFTSLATGLDQEVGESFWQYGIFDRFTRAKTTTRRPTTASQDYPVYSDVLNRNFNSPECGLRRYSEERQQEEEELSSAPESDISEGLKQRRQRLPLSATDRKKLESVLALINNEQGRGEEASSAASTEWPVDSFESKPQPSDNTNDSEFNLAARRLWLQQQLDSTLSMLGFSMSNKTASDFINDTVGLNLNFRERIKPNTADKNHIAKLGKALEVGGGAPEQPGQPEQDAAPQISGRQDDTKLEARVIGGTDARLGDSPWSVSLQALVSRPGTGAVEYRHYCGGTIISEHYVLTAAHCLDFMVGRESRLFVVIGDLSWRMSAASVYGRRFGVEKLIIHSGYKSTAFGHDIGLIKTKESMKPLKVNGKYIINSVCLPNKGVEHSGEAELVGWGLFSNRNEMADGLQIADVPILPRPLCVDLYRRRTGLIQWLIGIELITDKQVCAGTFGRGICQGDSGSALVVNEKSNRDTRKLAGKFLRQSLASERDTRQSRATIIGVVAFGGIRRCSYQSLPGVYMQTSKYLDWIVPRIQD